MIDQTDLISERFLQSNPNLHRQLWDAGVIINKDINEVDLLRERIKNADNSDQEYILHINPTLDCNLKCWYCYENHIPDSRMSDDVLESTFNHISSVLQNPAIKSFELGFFGGEPLYRFNEIAKKIISHTHKLCLASGVALHIHFTSNGTMLNNSIIQYLQQYSCGFQITLDGGKKFHDATRFFINKKGSYDIIVNNILKLAASNIDVIVRVNYTKENADGMLSVLESFKNIGDETKKHLKFDFQRIWQDRTASKDETEIKIGAFRRLFSENGFSILPNFIPHDVRNPCYGDKTNHILINYDGNVFGCTARDFIPCNSIGKLDKSGNINFNTDIVQKRNTAKLSKPVCQECRIAPICGGGCKQRALESLHSEECTFGYSDEDIDSMILDIFEYSFGIKE